MQHVSRHGNTDIPLRRYIGYDDDKRISAEVDGEMCPICFNDTDLEYELNMANVTIYNCNSCHAQFGYSDGTSSCYIDMNAMEKLDLV
jgi:hypothetical protein